MQSKSKMEQGQPPLSYKERRIALNGDFNNFRFQGLGAEKHSNIYLTMNRLSEDGNKIVVKVPDEQLQQTTHGYALLLDCDHVVFLKRWQVSENRYGNEVILNREYFRVKKWGNRHGLAEVDKITHDFNYWLNIAREQQEAGTKVKWKTQ